MPKTRLGPSDEARFAADYLAMREGILGQHRAMPINPDEDSFDWRDFWLKNINPSMAPVRNTLNYRFPEKFKDDDLGPGSPDAASFFEKLLNQAGKK